ncbi:MAG: PD40 domain-containing protein [Phycisphaerae bacterium]|nr:PD40 domain-containing protein [Phycisphaerae bacterium]
MERFRNITIIFLLAVVLPASGAKAKSASVLLQEGLFAEQMEGDLDAAIKVYERVLQEFPKSRAQAAEALLHIGLCYEKLGKQEAQKAYRRLIKEYADQHEPVAQARARLAAINPLDDTQQAGLVMRELDIRNLYKIGNYGSWGACLSRDGRKLVYCKQENIFTNLISNLVVRNLVSGEEIQITDYETGEVLLPVFSPDGNEIVYAYTTKPTPDGYPLHVVSVETGQDRTLGLSGWPVDWSRDGRFILIKGPINPRAKHKILSINKEGAELLDLPVPAGKNMRFSPDGRYLSYACEGNLYLFDIGDQKEIQITEESHGDVHPIWSSDGQGLLFRSQRRFDPIKDLCYVSIVEGKARGEVRVLKPDFSGDWGFSHSENGRLLYQRDMQEKCIYTVTIDPQMGQPIEDPQKLAAGMQPEWSPDGKQISYVAEDALRIMSADGSHDREIMKIHGHYTGTYAWTNDNHIYMSETIDGARGIYAISLSAKERRMVLKGKGEHLTYSRRTKQLAFVEKKQIFTMDLDGGNLRQVTSDNKIKYNPAFSPDGKQIAFESGPPGGGGIRTLTVVSVEDGTARELFQGSTPKDRFLQSSWSPDGTKIAWYSRIGIIRIGQVSGGKSSMFKVKADRPYMPHMPHMPRWSPDGTKMLFWNPVNYFQLMIMDNFLPELND